MLMDKIKSIGRTVIEITTTEIFKLDVANLCLRLLCNGIARWKFNTLKGFGKERIAQELGITRRAVDKQIATHDLDEYTQMLDLVAADLTAGLEIEMG